MEKRLKRREGGSIDLLRGVREVVMPFLFFQLNLMSKGLMEKAPEAGYI